MDETTGALADFSTNLANAVETISASVVRIEARRGNGSSGVIWTSDGHIVAADHTVEREDDIPVGLGDGRNLTAKLVARDPGSDLALLKIDTTDLQAAARADDSAQRVGHLVLAVGRPGPAGVMASLGIVSALGGQWRTSRGSQIERFVRTDATLYPGFSGGPLIDSAGRVVGINSWTLSQGAGLAIPVGIVAGIVEQLTSGGVRRAYLGVGTQSVGLPATLRSQIEGNPETGLMLIAVEADGPAERAGLLIGDILLSLDGKHLNDTDDLLQALHGNRVGTSGTFKLVRGGEIREMNVEFGQRS
jgi:serine protease DegQ